jgi:hypothetical protein
LFLPEEITNPHARFPWVHLRFASLIVSCKIHAERSRPISDGEEEVRLRSTFLFSLTKGHLGRSLIQQYPGSVISSRKTQASGNVSFIE